MERLEVKPVILKSFASRPAVFYLSLMTFSVLLPVHTFVKSESVGKLMFKINSQRIKSKIWTTYQCIFYFMNLSTFFFLFYRRKFLYAGHFFPCLTCGEKWPQVLFLQNNLIILQLKGIILRRVITPGRYSTRVISFLHRKQHAPKIQKSLHINKNGTIRHIAS